MTVRYWGRQQGAQAVSGGPEDDVDARVCVDDARHLADCQRKRGVLERLLHRAATERPQVAAVAAQG